MLPDLDRIVDTYLPVSSHDLGTYWRQVRRDVLPQVRELQAGGLLRWFSFLIHPPEMLDGREPDDDCLYIHLRLEPAPGVEIEDFIAKLPESFRNPVSVSLGVIAGVDEEALSEADWRQAWRIHGQASEWVLCLLEGHTEMMDLQQVVQFLHFITNPLGMGMACGFPLDNPVHRF